ncbi:uncharacterized protein LOC123013937, partial [Tribolium madens]|uniref:uncharacterized protein LOC123013937 n=1 Tax=Tribolium madens TaxID=41895 RepID=UPI001CF75510
ISQAQEILIVVPDDLKDYINELHEHCLKELGLTEDDHKNYNIHNKDPKMMCYMKCLMTTSKWMNLDESIQYDFILSSVHPAVKHILLPALDKCHDIPKGTMECEKAYNFNLCMFNADPENWFFI